MDIGYNAIRAVVYEGESLGSPEIFNKKFKNDILSLLSGESLDIKHQTYLSIQYLLHIFKQLEVTNIKCVATAVLRDHPKAKDFIKYIENKYNFDINVISGEKEAYLTALGLITGIKNCKGLAADLGGGSLELVEVNNKKIGKLKSFELGTKVLSSRNISDELEIIDIIRKHYGNQSYETLYLIGGALRFIGRLYIDFMQYPIRNLHNLEISTLEFSDFLEKLQISSDNTKNKLGRRKINKNAIFVAKAMIAVFLPKKIIISTYGLKEGVRIEDIGAEKQQQNIILAKIKYTCNYDLEKTDFNSYFKIVEQLLCGKKNFEEIVQIAIILLSIKHKFDKTLYPTAISEYVLSSEIPFTHRERVILALILAYTTNYKPHIELIRISKKLLSKNDHNNCQIIGHFLCIAEEVDGPDFTSPSFTISMHNNYLEIESNKILPRPIFEKICNRLKSIAYARKINL